jgi:hypothetical protein
MERLYSIKKRISKSVFLLCRNILDYLLVKVNELGFPINDALHSLEQKAIIFPLYSNVSSIPAVIGIPQTGSFL